MRSKDEIITQIKNVAARNLEVSALLICNAQNPVKLVELLRSRLDYADIPGGQIPQLYFELAMAEMRLRAAGSGELTH